MFAVYTCPLQIVDTQLVSLPIGSRVLGHAVQEGVPTIWVLGNPNAEHVNVEVMLVATGAEFDVQDWRYIDTFTLNEVTSHIFMRE